MESKEGKENAYDSKDDASWTHINFKDLELGERIGGGGVGVIYSGYFGGERVALKTLFDTRVDEVLKKAEEIEKNSNQLLNFTNIIKQNSMDVKKDILEHLWKVVISDNTVDQYESNLLRRICGLIYVPDKISAEIKLKLINSK